MIEMSVWLLLKPIGKLWEIIEELIKLGGWKNHNIGVNFYSTIKEQFNNLIKRILHLK